MTGAAHTYASITKEVHPCAPRKPALPPSVLQRAVEAAAEETGVSPKMIFSQSTSRQIAEARQLAYWLIRSVRAPNGLPRYGWKEIGRAFGRDHSTVLHGVRAHKARLMTREAA